MNTAEILRAAAARVRHGWCKGDYGDGVGVCAIGAIATVVGLRVVGSFRTLEIDMIERGAVVEHLITALGLQPVGDAIPKWNDGDGQTAENVATGLEYAALVWEQEQQQQIEQPAPEMAVCPS